MLLEPMKVEYPVMNTFIQYPALRTGSLEDFMQEREFKSCPASRAVSLEDAPEEFLEAATSASTTDSAAIECIVKHTFLDVPAMRSFSLEGFLHERELKSCPASRMASLEEAPEAFSIASMIGAAPAAPAFRVPRDSTVDSLENFFVDRESTAQLGPMMSMCKVPRDSTVDSLEEFFLGREAMPAMAAFPEVGPDMGNPAFQCSSFFQYPLLSDVSTAASTASERTEPVTPDLSDNEAEPQGPRMKISLTEGLAIESAGSAEHAAGTCKPCAFLWKPEGCQKGPSCEFCHLCPIGEVKRRKKEKLALRKMARGFQNQAHQATCFYGMY